MLQTPFVPNMIQGLAAHLESRVESGNQEWAIGTNPVRWLLLASCHQCMAVPIQVSTDPEPEVHQNCLSLVTILVRVFWSCQGTEAKIPDQNPRNQDVCR